ncbi:MAG: hypothetical protein L0Y54_23210, partial [Sporichthyaceae bacterium]|nr:hypothetical protein [Sporichthyaceae bacterium]
GVAHAQAYGATSNYCTVYAWYQEAGDQLIDVRCFNASGALTDTKFVANFARGSQGTARFAYLWANQASNPSPYSPAASYRYDAVDSSGIVVDRTGTGQYEVYLPAAGPTLTTSWHFQITAYATSDRCKVIGYYAPTRLATVACRNHSGSLADTRFSLSFASAASILGRTSGTYFNSWSNNSTSGVEHPSTGVYVMRLTGYPDDPKGHVVADSLLNGSDYCHIVSWTDAGAELQARVACFAPGGAPTDAVFYVAATW